MSTDLKNARIAWIGMRYDPMSVAVHEVCCREGNLVKTIYSEDRVVPTSGGTESWLGEAHRLNEILVANAIDVLFVAGCRHLLSQGTLALPSLGCYNVHPSLLPRYRGSNPIFWQYQRGDLTAGITVHGMDAGMDTGPICAQEAFPIPLGEPLEKIVPRYCDLAARLVADTIRGICDKRIALTPQDHLPCPFVARKTKPSDYLIEWERWPLRRIWHFLRMGSFVADAALPDLDSDLVAGDSLAPRTEAPLLSGVRNRFTWKVGEIEPTPQRGLPGSIRKSSRGYILQHPEGCIHLERVGRN